VDTREKYEEYVNTGFMPAVDPLVIDRAEGATYFGMDGSSFIDCFAGISVVNSGHANQQVMAAVRDRGVMIGIGGVYGNVLRIQPPLTISDQELDTVLAAMTEVLEA
jgi:4-aminobutyrate aminotransferase-like enzyme